VLFHDYDQAGLDAQYNLRARHPDYLERFARYARLSARARTAHHVLLDVDYGTAAGESLDIVPAPRPGAALHLFIHGGYWQWLDKSDFSFVATGFAPSGAAVASINYDLAPAADLDEIVRQCRASAAWLYRNARRFNADPARLFVSGHSAGGHLAAMLMATDWAEFAGLPRDLVKGGCVISGLFDLQPIRLSYHNEVLDFDDAMVRRNSPCNLTPLRAPVIVAVGGDETDEFLRQSREFAAHQAAGGAMARLIERPGLDHFAIVEDLADPESPLSRAINAQMQEDTTL
jgi:arylformamidase